MSGHKRRHLLLGVLGFGLLATLLSGCSLSQSSNLTSKIYLLGPLRGYVETDGERYGYEIDAPEHVVVENADRFGHLPGVFVLSRSGTDVPGYGISVPRGRSYKGSFVVAEAGPTMIQINTDRPSTGMWDTDPGVIARALFFIDAPVGAVISLKSYPGQDPEDMRVSIDRNGDGEIDDELKPVGTAGEDEISNVGPASVSFVNELPDGRAEVALGRRPGPGQFEREIQLYYALYPQAPNGQLYDGPFIVDEPSYLVYGAFNVNGAVGGLNEEKLLGGLAHDLELEIPVDGTPVEVNISQPGQQALLTYPVQATDRFELVIEPSTIGILPDAGLNSWEVIGRDGKTFHRQYRSQDAGMGELRLDPDWGYSGSVVVRLTNVYQHAPAFIADGPPMTIEVQQDDTHGHARFEAQRGDRLVLELTDITIYRSGGTSTLQLSVANQHGNALVGTHTLATRGRTFYFQVPRTGSYLVELTGTRGSVTMELRGQDR